MKEEKMKIYKQKRLYKCGGSFKIVIGKDEIPKDFGDGDFINISISPEGRKWLR